MVTEHDSGSLEGSDQYNQQQQSMRQRATYLKQYFQRRITM